MKPDEMIQAMLLEFDVTFNALIATLIAKRVFTMEELNEAKIVMRPIVKEKGEKQGEVLKKAMEKENPVKDFVDLIKKKVDERSGV